MDTVRYYLALVVVIWLPPAIVYWLIVHPFIDMWRRVGKATTFSLLLVMFSGFAYWLFTLRATLLAEEYGTNWVLWVPGLVCYGLAIRIQVRIRRQLTFRVLTGVPELDADGRGGTLMDDGLYATVRHPRYVAVSLGVLAWALFTNYLAMYVLVPITMIGLAAVIGFEERELARRFGAAYADYRSRVPMFIPRFGGRQ